MRIEENKIYKFVFPFMGDGLITLNVAADNQRDAAVLLKEWMNRAQLELAMAFPEVAPKDIDGTVVGTSTDFNALQLGLIEDLAKACKLDTIDLKKSIKKATKLDMTLDNFKRIVPALEALRDGKPLPEYDKEG